MKSRLFIDATVVFRHYIQVTSLYLEFGKENSKFTVTSFTFGLVPCRSKNINQPSSHLTGHSA